MQPKKEAKAPAEKKVEKKKESDEEDEESDEEDEDDDEESEVMNAANNLLQPRLCLYFAVKKYESNPVTWTKKQPADLINHNLPMMFSAVNRCHSRGKSEDHTGNKHTKRKQPWL